MDTGIPEGENNGEIFGQVGDLLLSGEEVDKIGPVHGQEIAPGDETADLMLDQVGLMLVTGHPGVQLANRAIFFSDKSLHQRPEQFHALMHLLAMFHDGAKR